MSNAAENIDPAEGLRNGDDRALDLLFGRYFTALTYFAQGITHDAEESRDIVITAFEKLWARKENFEVEPAIKSFLYITTRNACFDFLKSKKRKQEKSEIYSETMETADDTERLAIEAELLRKVYQQAAALPKKCREVFELTYYEGLNTAQIAQKLNMTVTNVTSQRSRAIQLLKMSLTDKEMLFFYTLFAGAVHTAKMAMAG